MDHPLHIPVMIQEVLEFLNLQPGETVWDLTLGLGGHSQAILKKISPNGLLVGLDQDLEALEKAKKIFQGENQVQVHQGNFRNIEKIALEKNFPLPHKILMDLGVSSFQLSSFHRGFSFMNHGPLDMRMNQNEGKTASEILNQAGEGELERIFQEYGEERWARKIAKEIIKIRFHRPLKSTTDLADIVSKLLKPSKIHPATRIFQALRIEVNQELVALEEGLRGSLALLRPGGRIAVISFHSLEDRIVKNSFLKASAEKRADIITPKPVEPSQEEIRINPRSRSAKLRILEKLSP